MEKIGKSISERIKAVREEKGETQKEFADNIGITRVSLGKYENNVVIPPVETLIKIANQYNVSMDWLCCLNENKTKEPENLADIAECFIKIRKYIGYVVKIDGGLESPKTATLFFSSVYSDLSTEIVKFLEDWNEIYSLWINGTIKDELYNLWVRDKMQELKEIPLQIRIELEGNVTLHGEVYDGND